MSYFPGPPTDISTNASVTGTGNTTLTGLNSVSTVNVVVSGTYSATFVPESSLDGANWNAMIGWPTGSAGAYITVINGGNTGNWIFPIGEANQFRLRCSSYTSGTATVFMRAGTAVTEVIAQTNIATIGNTATDTNSGNKSGGTQRVVLATDQPALTNALKMDGSAVTQPVSAAALPLPAGAATSAKQPALGSAGSASADVITVQGVTSMTALKTDGSGVTQPISGAVTANAGTNLNTSALALETGGNLATVAGAVIAQEATTNGVKGLTAFGAVTTAKPTYVTGKSDAISLDVNGLTRVSLADTPANTNKLLVTPDSVALPANQSVNVAQIGGSNTTTAATGTQKVGIVGNAAATLDSTIGAGTAPTNALAVGSVYNTSAPAPTNGQAMAQQADQAGNLRTFNGISLLALSAWNSVTALNATQTIFTNSGCLAALIYLTQTTTLTAGAITFEVSYDGTTYVTAPANCVLDPATTNYAQLAIPYTVQASTNKAFLIELNGAQALRIKLSTQITGTGAVTPNYALLNYSPAQTVIALSPTATNFKVDLSGTSANSTAIKVDNSAVTQPVSGTVTTTPPANASTNVAQVGGTTTDTNSGAKSAGTLRVVLATDQPALTNKLLVTPDSVALPANQSVNAAQIGGTNTVSGGVAGTLGVGGNVATNVAIGTNPINLGAQAVSAENTAVTATRMAQLVTDLVGKLIVLPYANPENFVSGAITTAMTGTTSTSLIAAPAAGLRNYITQITVSNSHATVGTDVIIQDGSGGTTLYTIPAAAVYGGATITFPTPLRQPTTATAIFCANVTTGSNTKVSASGYKGA